MGEERRGAGQMTTFVCRLGFDKFKNLSTWFMNDLFKFFCLENFTATDTAKFTKFYIQNAFQGFLIGILKQRIG